MSRILSVLLLMAALTVRPASGQVFLADDPLMVDPDRLDVPAPQGGELSDLYHFIANTFGSPAAYEGPALNVNTLGDVPNSSWYENRHYTRRMSLEALRRGPDTGTGPSTEGPWTVVSGKSDGKTAGMVIEDARGDRYLLKLDPAGYPGLTSAAEVIVTKLFYAVGYHVPENYVVTFEADDLVPGEEATVELGGEERPMTRADVEALLERSATVESGRYRGLASKFLEGKPLGPFEYHGTRPDDANDVIVHEARRELRGLRVFASWINHTDARAINSLDTYVEEEGRGYVRHHLIDFGSTMGAGPYGPKRRWDGFEYAIEPLPIFVRAVTLGFGASDWFAYDYPRYSSVGRYGADGFDPERWKPQYPNPAFQRMDEADAFWAAKQVMHFTEEELRAIVETGEHPEPGAAAYVLDVLLKRREAIGRAFLFYGGGLDRFGVEGGRLAFQDLPVAYGLVAGPRTRTVAWRPFDNESGTLGEVLSPSAEVADTAVAIPTYDGPYLAAEIGTEGEGTTTAYLRRFASGWEVVGVAREGTVRSTPRAMPAFYARSGARPGARR